MLIDEFKQDYFNNMSIDEIKAKYQLGQTTYFTLLKKLGIKRRPSSKIAKILGDDFKPDYIPKKISHIPIEEVYKKIDETDDKLIYEKQFVPRNTKINVEKKAKIIDKQLLKEVDVNELDEILNKADKTFTKIQNKKQSKIAENKNK